MSASSPLLRAKRTIKTIAYLGDVLLNHRDTTKLRWHDGAWLPEVQLPHGRLLVYPEDEGVGRPLSTGKEYEPGETAFLKATLREGMVFLDVGGNIGYFTTLAARLVGPSGRVIAAEPEPRNYKLLRANVERNGFTNVQTFNCALGDGPGEARLRRSTYNFGDHTISPTGGSGSAFVTVPVESADRLVETAGARLANVVKIDVQGYEVYVQRGMQRILSSPDVIVMTEFWPYGLTAAGSEPETYFKGFLDRRLDAFALDDQGRLSPIAWPELSGRIPVPDSPQWPHWFVNLVFKTSR